jgi:hypothetical protein
MPYTKESDTVLWLCGDGDRSIGYIDDKAACWYGPAEIMPLGEYEVAREGEVFECLNGDEYINRDGWQETSKYADMSTSLDTERMVALWV